MVSGEQEVASAPYTEQVSQPRTKPKDSGLRADKLSVLKWQQDHSFVPTIVPLWIFMRVVQEGNW